MKDREQYDAEHTKFIATRHPGQAKPAPDKVTTRQLLRQKTPMDAGQMFYGDEGRHEEDTIAWMQALNAKKVANDWSDKKAIDVFKSLLAEEKCAWKWWNVKMPLMHPTLERMDWSDVRKEFKKRWPPIPEIEEDTDLKREELESMILEPHSLVTRWGSSFQPYGTNYLKR